MGTFYHTTNYNPLTGDLNNMGTKKKKHPGTKGPHGPHAPYRGDYMPVKVEDKWVAKGPNKVNET